MIHTPVCDLLRIRHPIVLGGMAGATSVPLVAAVSNAGGLGTLGIARTPAEQIPKDIGAIRQATKGPFGVNFLLFMAREPAIDAALNARPPVFSAAWARADQDLLALWTPKNSPTLLGPIGVPVSAMAGIRIYQKYFPLPR